MDTIWVRDLIRQKIIARNGQQRLQGCHHWWTHLGKQLDMIDPSSHYLFEAVSSDYEQDVTRDHIPDLRFPPR